MSPCVLGRLSCSHVPISMAEIFLCRSTCDWEGIQRLLQTGPREKDWEQKQRTVSWTAFGRFVAIISEVWTNWNRQFSKTLVNNLLATCLHIPAQTTCMSAFFLLRQSRATQSYLLRVFKFTLASIKSILLVLSASLFCIEDNRAKNEFWLKVPSEL